MSINVFVADDSPAVRARVVRMLTEIQGVEIVGQAGDAPETIDAVKRLRPDAVVLDIHMPSGSGIDVLLEIRQNVPPPLVIILTNYPYVQYRERCLGAGADYFFDKSNEFEKITDVFRQRLEGGTRPDMPTMQLGDPPLMITPTPNATIQNPIHPPPPVL